MNEPLYPDNTPLKSFIKPGDVIFEGGSAEISILIQKFTNSKVNHALLAYDEIQSFETDGAWFKAGFHKLPENTGKGRVIIRPLFLTDINRPQFQALCRKYEGVPYDFLDIATNAIFSFLSDNLREKVCTFFGTKRAMKCDELVARILYELSGRKELEWFEGYTPARLLAIMLQNPLHYQILFWNL